MNRGDFYLTLLSDGCLDLFPKNRQSSFTVKLDHPIELKKEEWEVALTEIVTPTEILNINDTNNYFYFVTSGMTKSIEFEEVTKIPCVRECPDLDHGAKWPVSISPGTFYSRKHLINAIGDAFQNKFEEKLSRKGIAVNFGYGSHSKRFKFSIMSTDEYDPKTKTIQSLYFIFPPGMGTILGLEEKYFNKPIQSNEGTFKYAIDVKTQNNRFYVYSDLASYTFLANIMSPILRVIPFEPQDNNINFHKEFLNLHYVPLGKSYIDQVYITIKGDTGEDISFVTGKTLVKLHLRKIKNV